MVARRLTGLVLAAGAVAVGALAAVAAGAPATVPAIALRTPLPTVVRINQSVTVSGHVIGLSGSPRVALELARTQPTARTARTADWIMLAATPVNQNGRFRLRWRVAHGTAPGPIKLRVVALADHRIVAHTAAMQSFIGPAAVYCKPPSPPGSVPPGDGWIVGGLYGRGGAYPGIYACSSSAYKVSVSDKAGTTVTRESVPALHSYTLVLPAGTYTLTSGVCHGQARVQAGRRTKANTYCDYP